MNSNAMASVSAKTVSVVPVGGGGDGGREEAWQDGHLMVVPCKADVSARCVRCGEVASERRLQRLRWHPTWMRWLLLGGVVTYVLAAMVASKRAEVMVGVCEEHARAGRRRRMIGGVALALGFACVPGFFVLAAPELVLLGPVLLGFGAWLLESGRRLVRAERIDQQQAWLADVAPLLLEDLPP